VISGTTTDIGISPAVVLRNTGIIQEVYIGEDRCSSYGFVEEGYVPDASPCRGHGSFEKLKSALISAPVFAYFDVTQSHVLYVDACEVSIGAVLQQHEKDKPDAEAHPVGFNSRRLTPAEQNYATYDKELLCLRDGVLHFRHQLLGIPFTVRTDHCSLRCLLIQPEIPGQRQRWMAVLSQFQFTEIVHGVQNIVADVLSRYADPQGPSYEHLIPQ
jgi:hypothetical protein